MDAGGNTTELLLEQTEIAGTEPTEVGTEADRNRWIPLLLLIFVFIMIAINGLSLAAFAVEKRLRGYNNYFIINLTLSDFIFGFFLVITCLHMYLGRLPFPFPVRCNVFYGVSNSIQFVSNLIIVTICVDRHRAIYDPIGHFTRRRKRTALYTNICVWIVSLVFWFSFSTVPDYFLQFRLGSECFHWYSVFPIAQLSTVLIRFIIPFTITLILYVRIFIKIRGIAGGKHIDKEFTQDTTVSDHSLAEDDVKENKQRPQGVQKAAIRESASEVRSATKTLLFIVMAFFITWFPMSLMSIVITIDPTLGYPRIPYWAYWIPIWIVYVNGLLNPICYVISQPLFRKTVFGLLCHPIRYCRW
ncbi:trace amine-associated receptor 13c-like [Lytechinus variegatus]|uniref:trace amine-associated receptor 13c-like n=1 Tax=Lytechinus variegatus TaxID=7654 RepID=UPI001BB0F89C|nr:trace amine-associated receptor 13c-like [Lytechinus variegatus]